MTQVPFLEKRGREALVGSPARKRGSGAPPRAGRHKMRVSGARRAVEAILGVTVLLYLFGFVVALWP